MAEPDIAPRVTPVETSRRAIKVMLGFCLATSLVIGGYLLVPRLLKFKPNYDAAATKHIFLPAGSKVKTFKETPQGEAEITFTLTNPDPQKGLEELQMLNSVGMSTPKKAKFEIKDFDGMMQRIYRYDPKTGIYTFKKKQP